MDDADLGLLIFAAIVLVIYFTPTMIAFTKGHPNRWPIFLINLVFGCSVIGWVGSLIWACHAVHKSPTGNNGGETGLNVFINDVTATDHQRISHSAFDNLSRLKTLMDEGVIDSNEFQQMKQKYINQALR